MFVKLANVAKTSALAAGAMRTVEGEEAWCEVFDGVIGVSRAGKVFTEAVFFPRVVVGLKEYNKGSRADCECRFHAFDDALPLCGVNLDAINDSFDVMHFIAGETKWVFAAFFETFP